MTNHHHVSKAQHEFVTRSPSPVPKSPWWQLAVKGHSSSASPGRGMRLFKKTVTPCCCCKVHLPRQPRDMACDRYVTCLGGVEQDHRLLITCSSSSAVLCSTVFLRCAQKQGSFPTCSLSASSHNAKPTFISGEKCAATKKQLMVLTMRCKENTILFRRVDR